MGIPPASRAEMSQLEALNTGRPLTQRATEPNQPIQTAPGMAPGEAVGTSTGEVFPGGAAFVGAPGAVTTDTSVTPPPREPHPQELQQQSQQSQTPAAPAAPSPSPPPQTPTPTPTTQRDIPLSQLNAHYRSLLGQSPGTAIGVAAERSYRASIPTAGIIKRGQITTETPVDPAFKRNIISQIGADPNDPRAMRALDTAVILHNSLGLDRDLNFMRRRPGIRKITADQYKDSANRMLNAFNETGNPFAMTSETNRAVIGGTPAIPNRMTEEVAWLFSQRGTHTQEAIRQAQDQNWTENTLPLLHSNSISAAQRNSILDMERAVSLVNNQSTLSGQPLTSIVTAQDFTNVQSAIARDYNTPEQLRTFQAQTIAGVKLAHDRLDAKRNRPMGLAAGSVNADSVAVRMSARGVNNLSRGIGTAWDVASASAVFLGVTRPGTMLASGAWAAVGTGLQVADVAASSLYRRMRGQLRPEDQLPEDFFTTLFGGGYDTHITMALQTVSQANGVDHLREITASSDPLPSARGMLDPIQRGQGLSGAAQDIRGRGMSLFAGAQFCKKSRVRAFVYYYSLEAGTAQARGEHVPIPVSQLTNALQNDPQGTLKTILGSEFAINAMSRANASTMQEPSVSNQLMLRMYKNTRIGNFIGTSVIGPFGSFLPTIMRYLAPWTIPLDTTMGYILDKRPQHWWRSKRAERRGEAPPEEPTRDWVNYAHGNRNATYGQRMKDSFIWAAKIYGGTRLSALLALASFASLMGIEEPDDENLSHLWYEYKIGGVAFKESWFAQPNFGDSGAILIASWLMSQEEYGLALEVMKHGQINMMLSNQIQRIPGMIDFWAGGEEAFLRAQEFGDDELDYDTFLAGRAFNRVSGRVMTIWDIHGINEIDDFFRAVTGDNLQRTTRNVYTDASQTETERVSEFEAGVRRNTYGRRMWAGIAGVIRSIANPDATGQSGFHRSDMPLMLAPDEFQAAWRDSFVWRDEDGNIVPAVDDDGSWIPESQGGWPESFRENVYFEITSLLENADPEELAQHFVVIPYEARRVVESYLFEEWHEIDNWYQYGIRYEWNSDVNPDLTWTQARNLRNEMRAISDAYKLEVNNTFDLLWSNEIPMSPDFYAHEETSIRERFINRETGETASMVDFLWGQLTRNDQIEVIRYRGGNAANALAPFEAVRNHPDTFNFETPTTSQGMNLDFLREHSDRFGPIERGRNEGRMLFDVITADGRVLDRENPILVTGQRAQLHREQDHEGRQFNRSFRPFDLRPTADTSGNPGTAPSIGTGSETGQPVNWDLIPFPDDSSSSGSNNWNSSGGRGGRRGGGGGGSGPNIFSRPANSLNVNTPRGLSSSTPRSARFDYLRPNFQTKGSRTAWTRGDI